jgi:alpha-glucosidase
MVEEVIDKYATNNFPLETVYLDIPYMDKYADFTVDKKAFPDL